MDGKWSADLTTILRSQKLLPVTISCKGDDAAFGVYQHALANQFAQNSMSWKRGGKPFPYRLTFPLKFVQFDQELCWNASDAHDKEFAYLHIFFINSSSVDEYKSSVRHLVSEWFAQVSTMSDVQWLIVVDSTKAKEKKSRSSLMEKLKSDFSKFQTKVVEVSESVEHGSFTTLVQAVQGAVFLHLEILSSTWESKLAANRDIYMEDDWDIIEYFESAMTLARLYWSFGALEHSLSIYDDLDRFISMIILEIAEKPQENQPEWIKTFRKARSEACPTLKHCFSTSAEYTLSSYLDMRHCLLTRQIMLCLHMYYIKSRSRGAAPSLRVDFGTLVLKYAQHCHAAVYEHSRLLGLSLPWSFLASWTIFLVGDSLNVCGLLVDPTTIPAATSSLCYLHIERFNAMMVLWAEKMSQDLISWLKASKLEDGGLLQEALFDPSVFLSQLQKIHDSASSTLMQSERSRIAAFIGWQLAKFLQENGRKEAALPYKLRYLSRLLDDGFHSPVAMNMLNEVLAELTIEKDRHRIVFYHLLLSLNGEDADKRNQNAEHFIRLLSDASAGPVELANLSSNVPQVFDARITNFSKRVHIPLEKIFIEVEVISKLPTAIPFSKIAVTICTIDENFLTRKTDPVFELSYAESEQVCRMLLPNYHKSRGSISHISPPLAHLSSFSTTLYLENGELLPGTNCLNFTTEMNHTGCFVVDKMEMELVAGNLRTSFPDIFDSKEPVLMFVGSNPHKIWVEEGKDFFAGMVQIVEVHLEAGCTLSSSELLVRAGGDEQIEFQTKSGSWSAEGKYSVTPLEHKESIKICIPVYVKMDGIMTDSPAVRRVKFCFEWEDKNWIIELPFVALFFTTTRTSLLETQNLLEIEIVRTLAEEYTVVLESSRLEIPSSDDSPATLAKLLNPERQELVPNTVTNLVFVLPLSGDAPISHVMTLDYRVKSSNDDALEIDRLFSFTMIMDMRVKKVGYEICTQMLSQQPGAQLCRADSPCDLVVSLRSLMHTVEMLYIVLDADARLWTLNERAKVLQVKESGLGQIVFSVVPCTAGFLPYPTVSVYSCVTVGTRSLDGVWNEGVDVLPGSPLVSFHRTAGKQIRVLGASQKPQRVGEKREGFKEKLVKLFD